MAIAVSEVKTPGLELPLASEKKGRRQCHTVQSTDQGCPVEELRLLGKE
jgi:hypothetical protein